jgi:hypothetical protein
VGVNRAEVPRDPLLDDELPLESTETDGLGLLQDSRFEASRTADCADSDADEVDDWCVGGELGEEQMGGELQLEGELGSGKEVSRTAANVARCCNNCAAAAAASIEVEDDEEDEEEDAAADGGRAADPGGFADAGGLGNKLFGWLLNGASVNGFRLTAETDDDAAATEAAVGVTGRPNCPMLWSCAANVEYAECGFAAAAICCR